MQKFTCIKCGILKDSDQFYYHRKRKRRMSSCKECNLKISHAYAKEKRIINDLGYIMMCRGSEIRRSCKTSKREYDKDLKEILKEKWEQQKGLCYYTGIPMVLSNEYHTNRYVMTVDRKDSNKGYTKDNIVLCCSIINRMKQNLTLDELKKLCKTILDYNP